MELTEPIETINRQLVEIYGIDVVTGQEIFRVVFSDDQYENRLTDYDDRGNKLQNPEVRLLPKYKQWIQGKYILERLMHIDNPESQKELAGRKMSYECIFVFDDKNGNPLPPRFDVCQIAIDVMNAAMKGGGFVKYKEGDPLEERKQSADKLYQEMFGNESELGDALANKQSTIIVPGNDGVKH